MGTRLAVVSRLFERWHPAGKKGLMSPSLASATQPPLDAEPTADTPADRSLPDAGIDLLPPFRHEIYYSSSSN
jgi:hypothetical protein